MKKYHTALLIGRFQPFHKGHLYLMRNALEKVDRLIIAIGTANRRDEQNPWPANHRKAMLQAVIKKEGWQKRVKGIVYIDDYLEDDQLWLKKALERVHGVGQFELVIGNDQWTDGIFEQAGYRVWRTGFYKRYLYEGVKIRKILKTNGRWQNRVPKYLIGLLDSSVHFPEVVRLSKRSHYHSI